MHWASAADIIALSPGYATTEIADTAGTEAAGSSALLARADHVHRHGGGYAGTGDIADTADSEGAGSATTLARGDHVHALHVHGHAKHTNRARTLPFLPATSFFDAIGSPVLANPGDDAASIHNQVWQFPTGANTGVATYVQLPSDWDAGAISLDLRWSPSTTNTDDVVWDTHVTTYAIGDLISKAIVTSTTNTRTPSGVADALQPTFLPVHTPATSLFKLLIFRFGTDVADNFTGTAELWGVSINYTADM